MGMHHALMGTVDRRGYGGHKKALFMTLVVHILDLTRTEGIFLPNSINYVVLMSLLDAYILRYGNFCANDNNDDDDTTDYFTL